MPRGVRAVRPDDAAVRELMEIEKAMAAQRAALEALERKRAQLLQGSQSKGKSPITSIVNPPGRLGQGSVICPVCCTSKWFACSQ
jgi:hypothetical protein